MVEPCAATDRTGRSDHSTPDVLGRSPGVEGPVARLGVHRAPDGSDGGPVGLDVGGPHAVLVVGKRGSGKSYTLGVLAEELARTDGVSPVVVDPMGAFRTLSARATGTPVPATVVDRPTAPADALDPRSWCDLVGLDPESGPGSLVWRAAARRQGLAEMRHHVERADAPADAVRAATNHLELAANWDVFEPGDTPDLLDDGVTVLDVTRRDRAPVRALVSAVADTLYRGRVKGDVDALPWLLVDEAHAVFDGVARDALVRLLTRGRRPGVSLVLATQRPGALPEVAASQSDVVLAHRLTGRPDREALARVRPAVAADDDRRRPTGPGEATVVDDARETVRSIRVRERDTPHGGESPRVEGEPGPHRF